MHMGRTSTTKQKIIGPKYPLITIPLTHTHHKHTNILLKPIGNPSKEKLRTNVVAAQYWVGFLPPNIVLRYLRTLRTYEAFCRRFGTSKFIQGWEHLKKIEIENIKEFRVSEIIRQNCVF